MHCNCMIVHLTAIATEYTHCEGEGTSVLGTGSLGIVRWQNHSETLYTSNCTTHHLFIANFGDNRFSSWTTLYLMSQRDIFTEVTKFKSTIHSVHSGWWSQRGSMKRVGHLHSFGIINFNLKLGFERQIEKSTYDFAKSSLEVWTMNRAEMLNIK